MTTKIRAVDGGDAMSPISSRGTKVGFVAGGLGAYWPQFPNLLSKLKEMSGEFVAKLRRPGVDVEDAGFISNETDGAEAAERLRSAGCDLIVVLLSTYMTASMVVPIARRAGCPVLLVNLQPTRSMDHENFDTGDWLAYCGACPLPEMANALTRCGIRYSVISGYMEDERAWTLIERSVNLAGVRSKLERARYGLMGHLYPGMLDISTDLTMITSHFGGHVEVLEYDDLRVRATSASDSAVADVVAIAKETFDVTDSVAAEDLDWAARVACGLEKLVEDFDLATLAYYHRGLDGELHERLGAGMILGASLLTARGVPACGEYELRTSVAMYILDCLGAGGSFTEIQALNFDDGVVEMGHDGPGHVAISARRPLLRGLGVYHGKRGWGVSVEFDVNHGPVTLLGIGQSREGSLRLIVSEGEVVGGPLLQIGNTTSRVDFGCHPGEWTEAWSTSGVGHHWALGVGHRAEDLAALAALCDLEFVQVAV